MVRIETVPLHERYSLILSLPKSKWIYYTFQTNILDHVIGREIIRRYSQRVTLMMPILSSTLVTTQQTGWKPNLLKPVAFLRLLSAKVSYLLSVIMIKGIFAPMNCFGNIHRQSRQFLDPSHYTASRWEVAIKIFFVVPPLNRMQSNIFFPLWSLLHPQSEIGSCSFFHELVFWDISTILGNFWQVWAPLSATLCLPVAI